MKNVIYITERYSIDTTNEKWDIKKTKKPLEWTRKEYIQSYIKMLTKNIS